MRIALALYDRFTALDIVGPYQVLSALPGSEICFVAEKRGPVADDSGAVRLEASRSFAEVREADVVVVGGSPFTHTLIPGDPIIPWLREIHARTQWTASVCTGSLLLAAAGLLNGLDATSHWLMLDLLGSLGAKPTLRRVVFAGERIVTAAGVSSGIDMALALVERMRGRDAAEIAQLAIEYDPQPPRDAGSPAKARPEIVAGVRQLFTALLAGAPQPG
ncbi:MAG TPA: DJ-1/PfpI family protein [Myxococcota bacterium]|nr:DJ-1/PfpI family protein [Myxococcota bacterium]